MNKNINFDLFSNVQWRAEKCNSDSLLFYFMNNSLDDEEKFITRIEKFNPATVIINKKVTKPLNSSAKIISVAEPEWRELQYFACNHFYPLPEGLFFAGVTGTNGKTSTVHFIMQMCVHLNLPCLTLGTLGVFKNGSHVEDYALTSPSYMDFRRIIFENAEPNYGIFFEASSHALDQERFYQVALDAAGWASFSQDHLDYHQTMSAYLNAKKKIIKMLKPEASLFLPCSQSELANMIDEPKKIKFCMQDLASKNLSGKSVVLEAMFAFDNFSIAFEILKLFHQKIRGDLNFIFHLNNLKNVPGRFNTLEWEGKKVVIDYAHTPDALKNISSQIKLIFNPVKFKILFGCGGDRDRSKRPLMGQICSQFADYLYITSDNPRTENPEQIIDDIIPGLKRNTLFERHADRKHLLHKALRELQPGEVLLVAGKGHENYIILGTQKIHYSDFEECEKFRNKNYDS